MLFQTGLHVVKDTTKAQALYGKAIDHGYVWPMLLLASFQAERGNFIRSFVLRLRAAWSVLRLAPADPRLWNVAARDERFGQNLTKQN